MSKQGYYRQQYKLLNPDWQNSQDIYKNLISEFVNLDIKILDIGCGHGDYMKEVYLKTENVYGLDSDKEALAKNVFINHKIVGFADNMPFAENNFDLVVMGWVAEHLENPQKVFAEIYRVLKPGGHVVFLTPNVWNFNVWIIRLIPQKFHDFFTKKLYNRQENDTYKKYYRINSGKQIKKVLDRAGFREIAIRNNGDPSYISFNNFLFKLSCLIEKVLSKIPKYKVHLIITAQK